MSIVRNWKRQPRLTMKVRLLLFIIGIVGAVGVGLSAGRQLATMGGTDSPGGPNDAVSESYTLEDVWKRLNDGTSGAKSGFGEPGSPPGAGTMHTLNEIMGIAPARDNANGAQASDVASGKTFWGLTSGQWGLQTGSLTAGMNVQGPDGALTFTIPDGIYSGSKTATARDSLLSDSVQGPYTIRGDSTIFGVTGTHPHAAVAATGQTQMAISGDDGSSEIGASMFFEPVSRFTVSGDVVTDNLTGLMWTKNANVAGTMGFKSACEYGRDLVHGGYSDWRLANVRELFSLLDFHGASQRSPMLPDGHPFTNVQSGRYWTSTSDAYNITINAYVIDLSNGQVEYFLPQATTVYPGWFVRGMEDW